MRAEPAAVLSHFREILSRNRGCFFVALANLTQHRLRLVIAVLGTSVPIVLLLLQMAFLSGTRTQVTRFYDGFDFNIAVVASTYQFLVEGGTFDRVRLTQAHANPGVARTYSLNVASSNWTDKALDRRSTVLVFGVDDDPGFVRNGALRDGLALLRGNRSVLVDEFSASEFGSIAPGAVATVGLQDVEVAGRFRLGLFFYADGSVIMRNTDFARYTQRDPREVSIGLIQVAGGASPETVRDELARAMPFDVRILTRDELIAQERAFFITTKPIGIMLQISMWIAFLVGSVILLQVLSTDIVNRLGEFATLKAMGFAPEFVFGIGLFQALLLALSAFALAYASGSAVLWIVEWATHLPAGITPLLALATLLIVLAMCVLSAAVIVRRISQADPAELY